MECKIINALFSKYCTYFDMLNVFIRNFHPVNLPHSSNKDIFSICVEGAQLLSGRVLDSRPKGRGFKPHRGHCVVVLEQDTFILA